LLGKFAFQSGKTESAISERCPLVRLSNPNKKDVRRALELTVSQVNAGTDAAKADAKFMDVCALYRQEHLPTLVGGPPSTA
jgi:hypothetical protein